MSTRKKCQDLLHRWDTLAAPLIQEAENARQSAEAAQTPWWRADEMTADANEVAAEFAEEAIALLRKVASL